MRRICRLHTAAWVLTLITVPAIAETKDHAYTSESVSLGYQTYTDNCALCHGIEGNWVEGIDLSRQQFKTAVTDHDIRGVIGETLEADDVRLPDGLRTVLVVDPHDQDWTRQILNAVDKMSPDCEATLS